MLLQKEYVLEDSVNKLPKINLLKVLKTQQNLFLQELKIEFENEEKINDAGGLLREWVHIVSLKIVDP